MTTQTIINADCLEYMKSLPDKSFDLVLTDPPYGLDMGNPKNNKQGTYGKKSNFHEASDWDKSIPSKEYFDQMRRVSKYQIFWGANYYVEHLDNKRGWIVWDKMNDDFYSTSDGEIAWTNIESRLRFFRRSHGLDKGFMNKDGGNLHPTQKPLELMRWCIEVFSKNIKSDTILDPFMGSGTTLVACKHLNRNCVGIEISEKYCKIAQERLDSTPTPMF